MKIRIKTLECRKCGHRWVPRHNEIRQCPSCKTAYWDRVKE